MHEFTNVHTESNLSETRFLQVSIHLSRLIRTLQVTDEQITRARELHLPDNFYAFENNHVSGESERLTASEEAEEDALLNKAVSYSPNQSRMGLKKSEFSENLSLLAASGDTSVNSESATPKMIMPSAKSEADSLSGSSGVLFVPLKNYSK